MHSVLASAVNHPDAVNPHLGLFNRRSLRSLGAVGIELDVVSPRPMAPPVGPYSAFSELPRTEPWERYTVHHPRFLYLLPKRLFYGLAGRSFARRVPAYVERTFDVPDVAHACHPYLDGYGLLSYARAHDLPLFVVAHGAFLNGYRDLPAGVRSKVDETLGAATKVLCVSDALARAARQHVPDRRVETVPLGADPERYPTDRAEALREELGLDRDATVALFVGEFCERKGVPELLQVLSDASFPGMEMVFVGFGGALERDVRRAVNDRVPAGGQVYTGISSPALRRWLVVADLLVLPSRAEGRPTVIYEAMAAGTAVLATDVGGIPEQVVDGETGVLVPPQDPDALAAALTALVDDRERLRALGRAGRERLLERDWTWEGHARRVAALHQAAIECA